MRSVVPQFSENADRFNNNEPGTDELDTLICARTASCCRQPQVRFGCTQIEVAKSQSRDSYIDKGSSGHRV